VLKKRCGRESPRHTTGLNPRRDQARTQAGSAVQSAVQSRDRLPAGQESMVLEAYNCYMCSARGYGAERYE